MTGTAVGVYIQLLTLSVSILAPSGISQVYTKLIYGPYILCETLWKTNYIIVRQFLYLSANSLALVLNPSMQKFCPNDGKDPFRYWWESFKILSISKNIEKKLKLAKIFQVSFHYEVCSMNTRSVVMTSLPPSYVCKLLQYSIGKFMDTHSMIECIFEMFRYK